MASTAAVYAWAQAQTKVLPAIATRRWATVFFGPGASVHMGIVTDVTADGRIVEVDGNYAHQVPRVGPYDPARATAAGEPAPLYGYAQPVARCADPVLAALAVVIGALWLCTGSLPGPRRLTARNGPRPPPPRRQRRRASLGRPRPRAPPPGPRIPWSGRSAAGAPGCSPAGPHPTAGIDPGGQEGPPGPLSAGQGIRETTSMTTRAPS